MKRLEVMIIENKSRIEKAIGDAYELGKADGRAEAIEELLEMSKKPENGFCTIKRLCEIYLEQLKEQNKWKKQMQFQ